jgi:hypothetical protein
VSSAGRVEVDVERAADHLVVRWTDGRTSGSCRFDRLVDASPGWLGAADELLEGADRRTERRVIDAVAAWSAGAGVELGIWHDDAGVELLS